MTKLSVIVPVYNSEKYLKKCLDSLVNQKLDMLEVLLINDGSTDNSQNLINEYVEKFPNVFKSFTQENQGQAIARNVGVKNATGEFVTFVDSDDYIEEDAYSKILDEIENEDLDVVCFDYFEVIDGKKEEKEHYFLDNNIDKNKKYIVSEAGPWNKIIRRSLLIDNDIYFLENKIYEDLAVIPTLAKYTKKIEYVPYRIYDYVIRSNSTMRQVNYNKKMEDIFYVVDKLYNDFIDTEYKEELEYIYIEHLLHAANLRFFEHKEGYINIDKISEIIKEKFPNWRKNKYYKMQNLKYKITCNLFYYKQRNILKIILGGNNA